MEGNKSDKRTVLIVIVIIVAVLVLLVTLCGALCSYRNTKFLFKNQKNEYIDVPTTFDIERASECLSVLKGKSLLFLSDSEVIRRLDAVSEIKVIDVVKSFPNTVNVYLTMRNRVYYYHNTEKDKYYVFDEELKVFSVESKRPDDAVRIVGLSLTDFECLEEGEALELKEDIEWQTETMRVTADTFWSLGYDYGKMGTLISLFDLRWSDGEYTLILELETGGQFIISEPNENLEQRIKNLYGVFIANEAPKDGVFYVNTDGSVIIENKQ